MPGADVGPEGWSSRDKFAAVLETAALNEADLAEYCRKRGVFAAQIKAWRGACEQARKDRALAETAALLVLRKKLGAIWGGDEDA